ncbi:MAG: hypothetical protein HY900_31430 [Deltaproteobacteria bacterium]|nr:hypothetical protein [Deltaproteobacteria bacterium]
MAKFGWLLFVHAPETLGVESTVEVPVIEPVHWLITVMKNPPKLIFFQTIKCGDAGFQNATQAHPL